jgi:quercetin dioxygenase-like cupin family protein
MRRSIFAFIGAPFAVLAFVFALGVQPGSAKSSDVSVAATHSWTVASAPGGAWDVYLSAVMLSPGYWTGPHTHPGPEYGLIVSGQALRWDQGVQTTVDAGNGYYSATGTVHEGGGGTAAQTEQLSTHLLPADAAFQTIVPPDQAPANAPKPAPSASPLFRVKFQLAQPPPVPFLLTEEVVTLTTGTKLASRTGATLLAVVVDGSFDVTAGGATKTYNHADSFVIPPGQAVSAVASSRSPSTAYVVLLGGT